MLIAILNDPFYHHSNRYHGNYLRRWTVRAFAYLPNGDLLMFHLNDEGALGKRDCVETIGGVVQNDETIDEAIKRIVLQTTGYTCEIQKHIGYIVDHYNALNRETISNYFIVNLLEKVEEPKFENQEEGKVSGLVEIKKQDLLEKLKGCKGAFDKLITRRDEIAYDFYKKNSA